LVNNVGKPTKKNKQQDNVKPRDFAFLLNHRTFSSKLRRRSGSVCMCCDRCGLLGEDY
jgi:hypothetical protein